MSECLRLGTGALAMAARKECRAGRGLRGSAGPGVLVLASYCTQPPEREAVARLLRRVTRTAVVGQGPSPTTHQRPGA
eukprot:scaffold203_cov386-Prasinococcus_capsulatus_cf.AAC.32